MVEVILIKATFNNIIWYNVAMTMVSDDSVREVTCAHVILTTIMGG